LTTVIYLLFWVELVLSLVSFVRAQAPDNVSVKNAIGKSLDLIQFNLEKQPQKILIKPNLCYYYDYSTGETTDSKFVAALIDVLRERLSSDLDVSVVESDASAMRCKHVFKMLGYEKMAKEKDIKLVNLSKEKSENVEVKIKDYYFQFRVPQIFRESNMLVNVPKIKYQSGVKVTCALKNIYGCNAFSKKFVYHRALNEAIVGINKLIKTSLVVVDGIVVNGVNTKQLGLVMASEDPVATDTAAAEILGLNPRSVKHIVLASQEGIGDMQFIPKGENLTYVRDIFPRRKLKNKIRMLLAQVYMRYIR